MFAARVRGPLGLAGVVDEDVEETIKRGRAAVMEEEDLKPKKGLRAEDGIGSRDRAAVPGVLVGSDSCTRVGVAGDNVCCCCTGTESVLVFLLSSLLDAASSMLVGLGDSGGASCLIRFAGSCASVPADDRARFLLPAAFSLCKRVVGFSGECRGMPGLLRVARPAIVVGGGWDRVVWPKQIRDLVSTI